MANRYSPSELQHIRDRKIFFDANILIYLYGFGTPSRANWEDQYATLYSHLNQQNNKFIIDYIVVSEFVNRAIKIEYKNHLVINSLTEKQLRYKDYRNSQDGQDALADIYLTVTDDILKEFEIVEKSYSKNDLIKMCIADSLDFSDKAIEKICNENQFVLLTNDTDFRSSSIDTLSCHSKLHLYK